MDKLKRFFCAIVMFIITVSAFSVIIVNAETITDTYEAVRSSFTAEDYTFSDELIDIDGTGGFKF